MAVLGPTASGKSELAMALAGELDAEIVSVDSMQIYRGMDIGTAKPAPADRARVPHHMIDVVDPDEEYTVSTFQAAGRQAIHDIHDRGRTPMLTGGSGLHFRALVDPLEFPPSDPTVRAAVDALGHAEAVEELVSTDAAASDHIDLANPRRVQRAVEILRLGGGSPTERAKGDAARAVRSYEPLLPFVAIGVDPGDELPARVEHRMQTMIDAGLLDEVAALDGTLGRNAAQAVGYKQLLPVARGEIDLERGVMDAVSATIALARRQRTFFRRDPRIRWLPWRPTAAERVRDARQALEGIARWTS